MGAIWVPIRGLFGLAPCRKYLITLARGHVAEWLRSGLQIC